MSTLELIGFDRTGESSAPDTCRPSPSTGLPDLDVRERLLRHVEIDQDRIERLQRDDGRAGGQVLADVDLANAQPPGERRPDDLLLDQRLLRRHLGAGRFQRRHIGIDIRLADGLRRELFLVALVVLLGEFGGRLQLLQFGVVIVRLEPQQHLARRHLVAGIEGDFIDDAGRLRGEIGAAHGAQRADRLDLRLPRADVGRRRRSRRSAARSRLPPCISW